jgi:hypothetical protein
MPWVWLCLACLSDLLGWMGLILMVTAIHTKCC